MKWGFYYPHFSSHLNVKSRVEEGNPGPIFVFFHASFYTD
jgi:hypothetical protein